MSNIAGRVLGCSDGKSSAQLGLSLIELLISMLIAAFIFGGVLSVMLSGRNAHISEDRKSVV